MALQQKAIVLYAGGNQQAPTDQLNKLLAGGWHVVQVHAGANVGTAPFWLVIAEQRLHADALKADA